MWLHGAVAPKLADPNLVTFGAESRVSTKGDSSSLPTLQVGGNPIGLNKTITRTTGTFRERR